MSKKKHPKPSKRQRKLPELRIHLRDIGTWMVKTLVLPVITSVIRQYLISWLEHLLK